MKQTLLIFCGIPFSGKTTLATKLACDLNYQRIDLDEIKFELFGSSIQDDVIPQSGWDSIYQKMYQMIRETLSQGLGVIHDTGNFTIYERGLISQIAKGLQIPIITVFIHTPVEVARNRLLENRQSKKRFDVTDEAFESSCKEMEIPRNSENSLIFDYTTNYAEILTMLKTAIGA